MLRLRVVRVLGLSIMWVEAVFRIEGESPGADGEVARALDKGIPVTGDLEVVESWTR